MHLGFVSYEFPPDTGQGGIATYTKEVANAFARMGTEVDVFVASPTRTGVERLAPNHRIHFIQCDSREAFIRLSPERIRSIHQIMAFDGIEFPEYGAEARFIREALPDVPVWIKLHTPAYLVKQLNDRYYDRSWWRKIKKWIRPYQKEKDAEYNTLKIADRILAPCDSMRSIAIRDWELDPEKVWTVPNPYQPSESFTSIDLPDGSPTVIYVGRLETRKGVWNLAKAIPQVLKQIPEARFIFLGKDSRGPHRQRSMKKLLQRAMAGCLDRVEFIDAVPLEDVPKQMARASIAVFPSLWENFPNVCLEAMAAGRAIVASKEGGMAEMLTPCNGGVLVDPNDPTDIANGLIELLRDPVSLREMGARNRERVVTYYGKALTGELFDIYRKLSFH